MNAFEQSMENINASRIFGRNDQKPGPEISLAYLIELNNRYAIDGREPNSYSGIFGVSVGLIGHGRSVPFLAKHAI